MAISDSITRIVSTLVTMLQTRMELVTLELEEELVRFSTYFIVALIALFCAGVAISLLVFLIIALYWDEHRVAVLLSLIGFFSLASVVIAAWLRSQFLNKPRLLEQSIGEFKKDVALLTPQNSERQEEDL